MRHATMMTGQSCRVFTVTGGIFLPLAMCGGISSQARVETATPYEMEVVCRNWVSYIVNQQGD